MRYTELSEQVIEEHEDLQWIRKADVTIGFLRSDREKVSRKRHVLGECIRVKDLYKCFIPFDFLIVIYEPNTAGLSDEQLRVLLYHELLHVGVEEKDGEPVYIIVPHDVEDFSRILRRYGLNWAAPDQEKIPVADDGSEVTEDGEGEV